MSSISKRPRSAGASPPWAEELAIDHARIRDTMRWIEAELDRQCASELQHDGPLVGPFRFFRFKLGRHFELEEADGFPTLLARAPELKPRVDTLVEQHRDFVERMATIVAQLERAARPDGKLRLRLVEDIRALFDDLRRHDAEEGRLMRSGSP